MAAIIEAQRALIQHLRAAGLGRAADRVERCLLSRIGRRRSDGWPKTCKLPVCGWCGRSLARRWSLALRAFVCAAGATVSLAIVPLRQDRNLHHAVRHCRKSIRSMRDKAGPRWRDVSAAGMAGGDGCAVIWFRHDGIPRAELLAQLAHRFPGAEVSDVDQDVWPAPLHRPEDTVTLVRLNRGFAPLRIVVPPQRPELLTVHVPIPFQEPLPILIA